MVTVGDRYYWLGDMKNAPAYVRVVSDPDTGWVGIEWEESKTLDTISKRLLGGARWKKVASE